MDPLSITGSSFAIAGAIAKASIAIVEFSHQAKDASEDLQGVSRELQALSTILDPLTRNISRAPKGTVTAELSEQLESSLDGCALVVARIDSTIDKYKKDGGWTRTKWVLFGRGDMEKLRGSLEAYKMALSLGLQFVSMAVEDSIKNDTGAIWNETQALRNDVATIQVNMEEILARVVSIRNGSGAEDGSRTRQWVESMAVLSSYAESTYQETIIGVGDERETVAAREGDAETVHGNHTDLDAASALHPVDEEKRLTPTVQGSVSNGSESRLEVMPTETPASNDNAHSSANLRTSTQLGKEVFRAVTTSPTPVSSSNTRESCPPLSRKSFSVGLEAFQPLSEHMLDVVIGVDLRKTSAAVAWITRLTAMETLRKHSPGWTGVSSEVVCYEGLKPETDGVKRGNPTGKETSERDRYSGSVLRNLYVHIKQTIISALTLESTDWKKLSVEFHFTSRDVFYREPLSIAERTYKIKERLRGAGFGTGGPRHCAVLGPSETIAAATAALRLVPEAESSPRSLMIKVETTQVTIVLVERSITEAPSNYVGILVEVPTPSSFITDIISTWLTEGHPEVRETLGPGGSGPVFQEGNYRDVIEVLRGSPAEDEPLRLRFAGLPDDFRHDAFETMEGSIELRRDHLEDLFKCLVDKVTDLVKDALLQLLADALPFPGDSAKVLQEAVILEAIDTPKRFEKSIIDSLNKKLTYMPSVATDGKDTRSSPDDALRQEINLGTSAASHTTPEERELAAAHGLLLDRNPWNVAPGAHLEAKNSIPTWLLSTINGSPSHPDRLLRRMDPSKIDSWTQPTITQRWTASVFRFDPNRSQRIALDVYFSFNSDLKTEGFKRLGDPTKLCTITWDLEASDFDYRTWTRWWGRRMHCGDLDFNVKMDLLQPLHTAPRFNLQLKDKPPRLPTSVEWHCEPPFIVWPTDRK